MEGIKDEQVDGQSSCLLRWAQLEEEQIGEEDQEPNFVQAE